MHTDRDGDESNVILVTGRIVTPNGCALPVWPSGYRQQPGGPVQEMETSSGNRRGLPRQTAARPPERGHLGTEPRSK